MGGGYITGCVRVYRRGRLLQYLAAAGCLNSQESCAHALCRCGGAVLKFFRSESPPRFEQAPRDVSFCRGVLLSCAHRRSAGERRSVVTTKVACGEKHFLPRRTAASVRSARWWASADWTAPLRLTGTTRAAVDGRRCDGGCSVFVPVGLAGGVEGVDVRTLSWSRG